MEKLNNVQKAKEVAKKHMSFCGVPITECIDACQEMAEWKDQQAIEYLYKNIQSLLKDYGVSEASADIATQLFLANFKKAMEE